MAEVGRPTIMTTEVINKLEEVFAIGGSDEEACFYADISKQTLYNYQHEHPEFVDRKEALKQRPVLKARQTIVKALENPEDARWFLARKMKKEFSERQEVTGANGGSIVVTELSQLSNDELDSIAGKAGTSKEGTI